MKNNFRKAALSTICMLIVAVMSLTGVTYAWFTTGTTADVTGMEMSVSSVTGGILVSTEENGTYTQNLDLSALANAKGNNVSPVSTAGGSDVFNFFTAELDVANNTITTTASAASNYIAIPLWLWNDTADAMTINLSGSTITAKANAAGATLDGHLASRIGIMGATVKGTDTTGYAIYGPNETAKSTYLGVNKAATNVGVEDSTNDALTSVTCNDATDVDITVAANTKVMITVYVWLEGQDAQCKNAIAKSAFDINLVLTRETEQVG